MDGGDVSRRKVEDGDHGFLEQLFSSARERMFAEVGLPQVVKRGLIRQQYAAQDASYRYRYPRADYDLILIGGVPAGRIYVDRGADEIRLMEITLLPAYRGRGIGTRLIRELQEEGTEAGLPVRLFVEHGNPEARRLYERLGFCEQEDTGTHWGMEWTPGTS